MHSSINAKQVLRFRKVLFLTIITVFISVLSAVLISTVFPAYANETSKQDDNRRSSISVVEPPAGTISEKDKKVLEAYEESGAVDLSADSIFIPDSIPATAEEIAEANALMNDKDNDWWSSISVVEPPAGTFSEKEINALKAYEESGAVGPFDDSIFIPDSIPATAEEIAEINALMNSIR